MANFVFGPCPNSAQTWRKYVSHSSHIVAQHVFDEMPPWKPCKGSTSHLHATRPCPLLVVLWTAGSLADILIHFLMSSFALHRRDVSMPAMAMAELPELHGRRCSCSSKCFHTQPAPPPPPPLPPLQPALLGRGGRPLECLFLLYNHRLRLFLLYMGYLWPNRGLLRVRATHLVLSHHFPVADVVRNCRKQ